MKFNDGTFVKPPEFMSGRRGVVGRCCRFPPVISADGLHLLPTLRWADVATFRNGAESHGFVINELF